MGDANSEVTYADLDRKFFTYPFKMPVLLHPDAKRAFRHSKLSPLVNSGLMYAFVIGAEIDKATALGFENADTEETDTDIERDIHRVSAQTVRSLFRNWRRTAYRNHKCLEVVFNTIAHRSMFAKIKPEAFEAIREFIFKYAITDLKPAAENDSRRQFWSDLKACLYDCPYGLTLKKWRDDYGGITVTDMETATWRQFLELRYPSENLEDWYKNRIPHHAKNFRWVGAEINRKYECRSCFSRDIRQLDGYILQSIYKRMSQHRFKSPEDFEEIFIAATVSALCDAEIWIPMRAYREYGGRWAILSSDEQQKILNLTLQIDLDYMRLVNHISLSIIRSLAHHVEGVDSNTRLLTPLDPPQ